MRAIVLFSVLFAALTSCSTASQNSGNANGNEVKILKQSELAEKMKEDNVVVIDVRTPGEVAQGYITGADKFIDINGASFAEEIGKLDKTKTYVMYCRSGGRSGRAASYMVENGFTNVYNLQGGISSYNGPTSK